MNFFQPVQKLVTKTRQGAKVHRVYDRAQTPYQRLLATGVLSSERRQELEALYQRLNPLQLRRQIEGELERLWAFAAADPHRSPGPSEPAETPERRSSAHSTIAQLAQDRFGRPGPYLSTPSNRPPSPPSTGPRW